MLRAPHGAATRPTSEKVRQALFNILGPPGADVHVLDLFAGSGALGLEALSRGAASATFVERARPALLALRGNLTELAIGDRARVVATDVAGFLAGQGAAGPGPAWTWIFLDPPYAAGVVAVTLAALPAARLTADAIIVVEHAHREPPPERAGFLLRTDLRRYGDTSLSWYRPQPAPPTPTPEPPP